MWNGYQGTVRPADHVSSPSQPRWRRQCFVSDSQRETPATYVGTYLLSVPQTETASIDSCPASATPHPPSSLNQPTGILTANNSGPCHSEPLITTWAVCFQDRTMATNIRAKIQIQNGGCRHFEFKMAALRHGFTGLCGMLPLAPLWPVLSVDRISA